MLFKFVNPAEEADGPWENREVFGLSGNRNDEGDEPQLFKPAQRNCLEREKVKISNDKAAFAMFYANEANENKWRAPTATPENPLVEVFLSLTVMLKGVLGHLANEGCTPYKIWKAVGEIAGEASASVSEDDMILIQDFMMAASHLKAPTTEGGPQTRVPAMNCEHSRLARPPSKLWWWDRNKLQATLGPRLDGLPTSPTGPTRTLLRHVGAHPAPASADPFNMVAAIERMGWDLGEA